MRVLLTILLLLVNHISCQPLLSCLNYLQSLQKLYDTNKAEFSHEMSPFLIWSGKILDDLGFPTSCLKNPSNAYWEVEVGLTQRDEGTELTMYYGFCFTKLCDAQALNSQSAFFISAVLQNMTETQYQINSAQFFPVNMDAEFTVGSVLVSVLISIFVLTRMTSSFVKWGKLCMTDSEEEAIAVQSETLQEQKEAGRMPDHTLPFVEKYSLERAFGKLFQKQQSNKIYAFSLFKILVMPLIAFGYLFFLSNYGGYNYFSFTQQIYQALFAKVATFAYYLPDIFYFISGFVFSRKLIRLDAAEDGNQTTSIFAALVRKLIKLYPLYLAILLIYWFITPSIHAGPLWNVYMDQVEQCNTSWWRAILLIDNWWADGCFLYSWYVQVEVQFALLACLFFLLYAVKREAAQTVLYLSLIGTFISLFFGGQLPSSIETATSDRDVLYFHSFYSHIFFYLFGLYLAFIADKLSVRTFVKEHFVQNQTAFTTLIVVAFSLVVFIVLRPGVWDNSLSLQLAFCRVGVMTSFLIFFLPSLTRDQIYPSVIHKLSNLTYGIILCIGMITACGFWGLDFFAYVDFINLLQSSLSYLLISIAVGGPLAVIFDFVPFTLGS